VLTEQVVGEVLAATVTPPPQPVRAAGMTHRPSRPLADWPGRDRGIGVSHDPMTVLRRKFCLAPHRTGGFTFSAGPQPQAKARDVAGWYLAPPQNAGVACVDDKPQIQALDRTRPVLPVRPGVPGRHTRGSARHGTTALPAAPQAAAGTVTGARDPRRRHGEFPRFPTKAAAACPGCGRCATTTPRTRTPACANGWPGRTTSGSPWPSCPPAAPG
jgi:hypothetical protein